MAKQPNNQWTVDPREALRAAEGFDLSTLDRASTPGWDGDKAGAAALTDERGALLPELQERLFAEGRSGGKRSVLCVVQGLDTSGKGGIVRHVMGYVDPQGVALRSFGVPTEVERKHHYLWRIRNSLPKPGYIGVFDRSHYEDVLVVRVDELVEQEVWEKRYAEINRFERQLVDSGTTVLKFALMPSHEEQGLRLMARLDRPDKHWKYKPGDLDTRAKWDDFQAAYQSVFDLTNTDYAPWYVIPADRKWYPRLAITEILTRTLVEMDLQWPKARWRVDVQRRNLAKTMATAQLAESLAETEAEVRSGMESSLEVTTNAADILHPDADTEQATEEARGVWLAALEQAVTQKTELLAARTDAPAAAAPSEDPDEETEVADDDEPFAAESEAEGKKDKAKKSKDKKDKKKSAKSGQKKDKKGK